jgi:rubrerythrin
VLGGVNDTEQNLKEAISGETHEFTNMYPQMISDAKEEGNTKAERTFEFANAVEKIHADLYQRALADLGSNEATDYHVCTVCGNTVEGEPPEKCPICKAPRSAFEKVE